MRDFNCGAQLFAQGQLISPGQAVIDFIVG